MSVFGGSFFLTFDRINRTYNKIIVRLIYKLGLKPKFIRRFNPRSARLAGAKPDRKTGAIHDFHIITLYSYTLYLYTLYLIPYTK